MHHRHSLSIALLLVFVVAALGLAPVAAQGDNILHIVAISEVRTVDPHIAYEFDTWPATALFYRGLVTLADVDTPTGALADSWTINDEGTVYTFHLRDGIKFSNGRDITPDDVQYSFERLLNPATASPTSYMFSDLVGADAYMAGTAAHVSGIRIVDDRTVEFSFNGPNWTLMKRFALPPAFIIAREGVESATNFGRQPLGAGPFVLDSWDSGVSMKGSRNPYYWREGYPKVDGFEISFGVEQSVGILRMESGDADTSLDTVPNDDYPRLAGDPALSGRLVALQAFPNTDYVTLNTNIAPFDNIDVRRALDMAIDRDHINQINNGRSVTANGMLPPVMTADNKSLAPTAYDPEGAKALLTEAGFPDGLTFPFYSSTDAQQEAVAQAIIADWAAIGVTAEYTALDNGPYVDYLINQPEPLQVALVQWWNDYVDPSNSYEALLQCGQTYNWGHYCNPDLDAQFAAANLLPPGDARWTAFSDLEAAVQAQLPNLYLYHMQSYYFTSARLHIESDPAILLKFDEATVQ